MDHLTNTKGFSLSTLKYLVCISFNSETCVIMHKLSCICLEMMFCLMSCIIFVHIEQVLDEADRLLNDDFEKSLDEILNVIPRTRQTYLFSATMTKKVYKFKCMLILVEICNRV